MKRGAHSIHRPLVPSAIVYAIGTVVGAAIASSIAGWIALPVSVVFLMASLRFRRIRFALVLSCIFVFHLTLRVVLDDDISVYLNRTVGRLIYAGDAVERRGLSGSVRTDETDELIFMYVEV